jgi:predicted anti-sigma-YlaC factor YlaD
MKTCKDFCEYLSDYLDGAVGDHECHLIEEHLALCEPCALAFESLKITVRMCEKGVSDYIPDQVRSRLKLFLRTHCKGDQT